MLYEGDISQLVQQWEDRLDNQTLDYKVGVMDCIYDLKNLIDKQSEEEALANEAFQQQMKEGRWDEFFDSLIEDGLFA